MAFKKIHRRSDLLKKRADILGLGASTTSSSSTAGPHGVQEPTGPPLVLSSTHSTSAAAGATTTSSSAVSAPTSASSSVPTSVPTTPPAASSTPNGQVNTTPGNLVTRASSTVRVTVTNTSHSASASATTAESDSGMGIGSIAGIGVAAIVAIGVASAFVIWLIKRRNKNRDIDEEPFNRNSFMRHSAAIPDDDDSHLPGVAPRPPATPAMSERNPTPLYGQQNVQFGGSDFGYATQPSYGAPVGGMYSPNPFGPGGAPATPLPHSPGYGNTYDQGYGGQPGGYQELTRGGPHDYPPSPGLPMENPHSPGYGGSFPMPPQHGHEQDMMHNPHGDGVVRSMTPVGHGQVVSVPDGMHDGRATPVQMGFAPPPQHPQHPQQQGPGPNGGKARPETVYDTDDAYGGI